MKVDFTIILIHQLIFQGMFLAKNLLLRKKIGISIRGKNREAVISILFICGFVLISILISRYQPPIGHLELFGEMIYSGITIGLLFISLLISGLSLIGLKDSWRVGIIEKQETKLIETGIYSITRNPYFLSYIILFFAYAILLENVLLLFLSLVGIMLIHGMIKKEEIYLEGVHGSRYLEYKKRVPRYLLI